MKPNSQRARNAIYSLYSTIFGSILMLAIASYTLLFLCDPSYQFATIEEYNSYIILIGIISFVYIGIYITCWVLFIMWFRRAYYNLHSLIPSPQLRYSEGWAAGAWFIPIFNLWGPFQIASDLFSKSEALLMKHNLMEGKPNFHLVKNWWWGLWITAGILSRVSSQMGKSESLIFIGTIMAIIGSLISIGAAILAARMIKNYSQMEHLLKQIPDQDGTRPTMLFTNDDLLDSGI